MRHPATGLVARALAIYLFFWAISDALSLPRDLVEVMRYARHLYGAGSLPSQPGGYYTYLFRVYMLQILEHILRIALWLMTALWFAQCGPRVQELLNVPRDAVKPASEPQP